MPAFANTYPLGANYMLKLFKSVNNRKILYLDIVDNISALESIELSNWAVFVIEDNPDNPILLEFAKQCIQMNVMYMTATGTACSVVDDIFDYAFIDLEISGTGLPNWKQSEEDILMTTWNHDLSEGFWFITTVARNGDLPIDVVLVANLTPKDHSVEINQLVTDINNGWRPED